MDTNIVRDITDIYFGHIAESSHLETDMKKRREANEKAIKDMKKTKAYKDMAATAAKKFDEETEPDPFGRPGGKYGGVKKGGGYDRGYQAMQKKLKELDKVKTEALDPVGQEDSDIDNDGDTDKSDKYLHKRRKTIGKAIANRSVKEGFSNWREDLIEIMDVIEKEKKEEKITEKKVNNKIKINPNLGEAIENIGGTLLEMVEIDEVDFIVESVYSELLEEGYDEDDIEEAIEYALTEATVTYGHDTDKPYQHKKKTGAGQLVKAVGRLARQKLSSKVRGAKTSASAAIAKGARNVAKGALGVARKMEGDKKPSKVHSKSGVRTASTYSGAGAGTKEKVSSGSYTPPVQKKASEKPADPWKGSATVPSKPKPKPKAEKPADPWAGSATTPAKAKPKAATKKAAAPKAKAPAAAPKRKRKSKLDDLLASVRSEELQFWAEQLVEQGYNLSEYTWDEIYEACEIDEGLRSAIKGLFNRNKNAPESPKPESRGAELRRKYNVGPEKSDTSAKRKILDKAKKRADLAQSAVDRGDASQSYADKSKEAHQRYLRAGYSKYGASSPHPHGRGSKSAKRAAALKNMTESLLQIDEKTLSTAETKEKERIVKTMKSREADFEKRYPGRGKEVMYATATKMAKRIAEQTTSEPQTQEKPLDTSMQKQKYSNLKMIQQKQQQIQKQKLNLQKQGKLPLEAD